MVVDVGFTRGGRSRPATVDGYFVTVNSAEVVRVRLSLVPLMVNVKVPRVVFGRVMMVRVEEPEPVTEGGSKLALVPLGSPVTPKVTVPPKPPVGVTVTV